MVKYIVFKSDDFRVAVLFPEHIVHSTVRIPGCRPESAGFAHQDPATKHWIASGQSNSLELYSSKFDGEIIECSLAGGSMFYAGPTTDDRPYTPLRFKYKCEVCGHVTDKPINDFRAAVPKRCGDACCGGPTKLLPNENNPRAVR